jgi:N-glycosylase/DNA lyase
MYKMERNGNVFYQTFSDFLTEQELTKWIEESEKALAGVKGQKFYVFADLRTLKPLTPAAGQLMAKGQEMYRKSGMERSVVILADAVTSMQFMRLAKQSGIDAWERYIDASTKPNFKEVGMDWLLNKKEPAK